ncbi:hypothetical protein DFA_02348 [Cavenderia fasciculata]|uniref:Uncharacterized protein n=1 Tax=Cavenderia fasciculata TaxID=261658 RepID=F4PZ73_CACFS|nr:uncharacterized protein DFA_02348 [Cavenderia fasciculata]EGG19102.1 hypothetical protein DFA_02348 [Cavenderia fasciculata]|eukprot:XP_004366735.1 hypothetical protein DFA_02348 [Cavenderia fasciculata]
MNNKRRSTAATNGGGKKNEEQEIIKEVQQQQDNIQVEEQSTKRVKTNEGQLTTLELLKKSIATEPSKKVAAVVSPLEFHIEKITSTTSKKDTSVIINRTTDQLPKEFTSKYFQNTSTDSLYKDFKSYFSIDVEKKLSKEKIDMDYLYNIHQQYYCSVNSKFSYCIVKRLSNLFTELKEWNLLALVMVLSSSVSSSSTPSLIPAVVAAQRLDMVPVIIRYMTNIKQTEICSLLKESIITTFKSIDHTINFVNNQQLNNNQNNQNNQNQNNNNNGNENQKFLEKLNTINTDWIDWITGYNGIDYDQMVECIRAQFDFTQTRLLFNHLFFYINRYLEMHIEIVPKERRTDNSVILSLEQLTQWVGILLDSHYQDWDESSLSHYKFIISKLVNNYSLIGNTHAFFKININNRSDSLMEDITYSIHTYDI